MARRLLGPRKRRTRQHVIADQSVHYVEGFILDQGHVAQRLQRDYGYDLLLLTYDERGYVEPGYCYLQLKAAESLKTVGADYVFDLDVRDYNLWMMEKMPVVLILFDALRRRAYWMWVQRYFGEDSTRRPKPGAKTVRVRIPQREVVNQRAIARLRDIKQAVLE